MHRLTRFSSFASSILVTFAVGCGLSSEGSREGSSEGAASGDAAAAMDASRADGDDPNDARPSDATLEDSGEPEDAAIADASDGSRDDGPETLAADASDAGGPDASDAADATVDAFVPDAGVGDADASDAGALDANAPDARAEDASTDVDAEAPDANGPDAGETVDASDAGATCRASIASGSTAVAYQINPAHTGAQPGDKLVLPLCRRWSRDLGGAPSYALVAGGRVFVTAASSGVGRTRIFALDERSGAVLWGPIDLGGESSWSNAAYDRGRVFAVNAAGALYAFEEATGAIVWQIALPNAYAFSAPPTASGGFVYVSGAGIGGTVFAVDEANGNVVWSKPVSSGDISSPAVSADGIYVSYACNRAYGFAPSNGALLWQYGAGCSGGGGKTVALHGGKVYARDASGNVILDALLGTPVGSFQSQTIPALYEDVGYFVGNGKLEATPLGAANPKWSLAGIGATALTTPAVVVGPHVVVANGAGLYVMTLADGDVIATEPLPEIRPSDEQNVDAPLAGLAAADGMLFVPAGNRIVAY
jgi:outer membrane protein assembly factor BamB